MNTWGWKTLLVFTLLSAIATAFWMFVSKVEIANYNAVLILNCIMLSCQLMLAVICVIMINKNKRVSFKIIGE